MASDIKPSHRGRLHKKLGIPLGKKIPHAVLEKAAHSKSAAERREAQYALNVEKK